MGVEELNKTLADLPYVSGYTVSSADSTAFAEAGSAPDAKFPYALRWYNHIASFSEADRKNFPAEGESPSSAAAEEDDDDFDLFGSDDEDDEAYEQEIIRRAKALEDSKIAAGKVRAAAKSAIVLDVKPWSTEVDLKGLEQKVRDITMEGLEWKASELKEVAYGIKKLVISAHIVDDLVSTDDITDKIEEFEDDVQSIDVASFTKL